MKIPFLVRACLGSVFFLSLLTGCQQGEISHPDAKSDAGMDADSDGDQADGTADAEEVAWNEADSGTDATGDENDGEDGGSGMDADGGLDAADDQTTGELPSGNNGIAARHPGDVGIGSDPAVVFFDDFEGYADASGLYVNWNAGVYHNASIASGAGKVFAGNQSLQFYSPQQDQELSNGVARGLAESEEVDVLFLRFYSRFDPSFDITGSSHNGGGISAHYFVDGNATPGIPADGTNKFLAEFECWRDLESEPSPGRLNIYVYHPEQRSEWGDHWFPDGTVLPLSYLPGDFGDEFVPRPDVVPELGRWYAYEVMVKANTPGARDGRIACWVDGQLVADFTNVRLRDVATLKIDRFGLSLHSRSNMSGETWKWYDNVVAATEYIGPLLPP